jgi:integrase
VTPFPTPSLLTEDHTARPVSRLIKLRTLADVTTAVETCNRVAPERQKVLVAAVRTAARLLDRPLETISAEPKLLLPLLAQLTPTGTGRSAKTIDNTRSLVKEALVVVGAGRRVRHDGTSFTAAWQALYEALPTKRLTSALSRFMHYANRAGCAPEDVDQVLLHRFVQELTESGEVANVQRRHRDTAVFWNRCVRDIARWPQTVLHEPLVERPRRNLDYRQFSPAFVAEVDAYCTWLSGADVFIDDGPPKPCKPNTIRLRRELIRIAASHLAASGVPVPTITLDVLIDVERAKTVLRRLHQQNGGKVSAFIQSVATELINIARHYRKTDPKQVEDLKRLRRQLGPLAGGMTKKNQRLLQQLEDERLLGKLLEVPAQLALEARPTTLAAPRRVQLMQTAVAIELLLCAPIRLGNLCALELDRHLPSTFNRGDVHLSLMADEVKNGRPMMLPLSRTALCLLDHYVREFRSLLAKRGEAALFVGPDGRGKSADSLRDGITKAIWRKVGIRMTPHQFRHLAGELILRDNPGAYTLVQQLLGHLNLKTTLSFYAGDQSRAAGRVLDEIIENRRQGRTS